MIKHVFDPCNHWNNYDNGVLKESCGLIPLFIFNGLEDDWEDRLNNGYGFPIGWMNQAVEFPFEVKNDVYHFPDDDPLYPLVKLIHEDKILNIYQYGIVCISKDSGKTWKFGRLD